MITHIDEIPYFGEHTQLTLMCNDCGGHKPISSQQKARKPEAGHFALTTRVNFEPELSVLRPARC